MGHALSAFHCQLHSRTYLTASTYPITIISVNTQQTATTTDACTYVKRSNGGCITTAKTQHRLHDACVDDFLSKWTDATQASLITSDVFTGFYYVSPTKKLRFLLLPILATGETEEDVVVGTASNSTSLSMFYCIKTSAIGNLFAMVPANMPCGSFHVFLVPRKNYITPCSVSQACILKYA